MDLKTFKNSANDEQPPSEISSVLEAMWHQLKGDWDTAHGIAQSQKNTSGNWVHAYLHRAEGDNANAAYWYNRAGKPVCTSPLDDEWEEIAGALMEAE